ncbi:DMT family transporter [Piscirickettsia litoralis]|uniref:EamA domain-containing protein n=1 Tax=Piscirickettsia litoralis TaxID=1891921 RepID=A0ABX3A378_9GAMM|nr:DMT family transporter [Piscirickettsia litoralis]ODN43331.1 hypothetical protein BGC07_10855 [Piscirickettsia litoralis]
MNRSFSKGIMYTLLSSLCIAFMGVAMKEGSANVSDSMILFFRTLIPFIALLFFINSISFKQIGQDFKIHLLRALTAMIGQFAYIACINQASIFEATLLYYTGPLFIPVLARIFYKKPMNLKMVLSIIIGFIGVALVAHPDSGHFNSAILLGLFSGFAMAVSQVCNYGLTSDSHYINNVFALYGLGSIVCLIPLVVDFIMGTAFSGTNNNASGLNLSWFILLMAFILPGLLSLGNQALRDLSYRQVENPGHLSPFMFSAVVFSAILEFIIFAKVPNALAWGGMVLITLSSILIMFARSDKKCEGGESPQERLPQKSGAVRL